jgi:VWFA-related protein
MVQFRICFAFVFEALIPLAMAGAASHHPASAPASQIAPAVEGTPSTPSSVLQSNANLVLVDVVATDRGTPVLNIPRDRFHIFENGKERPIVAFDLHRPNPDAASVKAQAAALQAQIASLPPHTYTNLPVYPDTGTINVLLLDALNTPMADQAEARRQMIDYMSNIPPGTPTAIFTLASHLQMIEGFTVDAAKLAGALKNKKASSSQSVLQEPQNSSVQTQLEEEAAALEDDSQSPSIFAIESLEQFEDDLTTFQTDLRMRMTLDAFDELARYLGGIPGRKNLIWFSGAFPITLDPDQNQTSYRNAETYADQIRKTDELLTAARVAVYPVDARGLMNMPTLAVDYQPSGNSMRVSNRGKVTPQSLGQNINSDETKFFNQNEEEHQSMKTVAEETGGRAFFNTNDLKGAVGSAIESGDSFYTLAFVPRGKLDGQYRRIKVEIEGSHYELAYRRGYYADSSEKSSNHNPDVLSPEEASLLRGAPDSTQVIFAASVLPADDPEFDRLKKEKGAIGEMASTLKGPLHRYIVQFTVEPDTLTFNSIPGGLRQARLEFVLMAYSADGNRVNYEDRGFQINLNPDRYAFTMKYGVRGMMALDLPPGQDSLRVAVIDLSNQHTGSLEVPLNVGK